jgi:pimeloyl-ACP methyl ester carboxylesterase
MSNNNAEKVRSEDGTQIAFERKGSGIPLVFVDGAFCSRTMGPGCTLAPSLQDTFTTYVYDRRGRGGSQDTLPYDPKHEVEDLAALIEAAGESAYVFGHSSGAVLALEAARAGVPINALVLYEAPLVVDDRRPPVPEAFPARVAELAQQGQARTVVRTFMSDAIRVPKPVAFIMSMMPGGGRMRSIAHTVAYDAEIMNPYQQGRPFPAARFTSVEAPAAVLVGSKSPEWIQASGAALAGALRVAELVRLEGQRHMVKAKATAPVVKRFLLDQVDKSRNPASGTDR